MINNTALTAFKKLKNILTFSPPTLPDPFVLDEDRPFDSQSPQESPATVAEKSAEHLAALLRFGERLATYTEKVSTALKNGRIIGAAAELKGELAALERQWGELAPLLFSYRQSQPTDEVPISTSLEENRRTLQEIYKLPLNKDVVIKEIELAGNPVVRALVVYMEGLVDSAKQDRFVLEPLMADAVGGNLYDGDFIDRILKKIIPNGQVHATNTFQTLQEGVNRGDTILIIDGIGQAVIIETKGWEHRAVNIPQNEQTVRGSQAAFSENLRTNTGLIRSILRSSDLITEMIKIGVRGQTNCALMYIASIANSSLVTEVRRRLNGIETDFIIDSGQLVQFVEDYPRVLFPQTISTERPDRVAASLVEGRIALILEGNPFAQILPVDFFGFFHSAEDFSLRSGNANFMRILRLFGALISTVLPSLYLALSYFHPEAMPTELLLAIAGSRENVPFPAVFEVLVMEISFELIREAGIRIPGVLGSTIGIVGAIILGQAAVTARIVSPIVVVIVAITGLASYTIPEYRMAAAVRIIRFGLLIAAWALGLVGLAIALLAIIVLLCGIKSFGMPYMSPITPRSIAGYDVVIRGQVYNQEWRPDALNTKDERRQPTISRIWKRKPPKQGGDK
ncbi:MAG: spore germination protein [Negativicutes bacterium]|nr:spore germination protein [Negativicutes bacterium]